MRRERHVFSQEANGRCLQPHRTFRAESLTVDQSRLADGFSFIYKAGYDNGNHSRS